MFELYGYMTYYLYDIIFYLKFIILWHPWFIDILDRISFAIRSGLVFSVTWYWQDVSTWHAVTDHNHDENCGCDLVKTGYTALVRQLSSAHSHSGWMWDCILELRRIQANLLNVSAKKVIGPYILPRHKLIASIYNMNYISNIPECSNLTKSNWSKMLLFDSQ